MVCSKNCEKKKGLEMTTRTLNAWIVIAISLVLSSCYGMVRQPIPKAGSLENSKGVYYVTLKNGKTHVAQRIDASSDSAYFNDTCVNLGDIKAIETKEASAGKTLALLGLVYISASAILAIYLFYMLVPSAS